jgi:glycosyltransferase involved in cell wall biosynthesis
MDAQIARFPLTVVIPTLGGDSLGKTIEALNRGSVVPEEILVCVPAEHAHRIDLSWSNVRILSTDCRGQVAQRAVGFRNASHAFVMQLDDDLVVDEDCLRYLLDSLQHHGPRAAVSPSLIDAVTGESIYKRPNRNRIIETLYNRVMNGSASYQQGRIQKSGGAVGVDPQLENRDSYHVEWLPGGCVLHHRANLVLDDFYPFKGKAYCEDIIHSHYLTSRGVTPIIESRALCGIEPASDATYKVGEFLRAVVADYHARRYFIRLTARHPFRLYLFVLARCLSYINGRLTRGMRTPEALKAR